MGILRKTAALFVPGWMKQWLRQSYDLIVCYLHARYVFHIGEDELGIICPYGIGDTYIVCALAKSIADAYGVRIVLIVKDGQKDIPAMFGGGISRVCVADMEPGRIRSISSTMPLAGGSLVVGHPDFAQASNTVPFIGYKGLNLMDCYRIYFRLPSDAGLLSPRGNHADMGGIHRMFDEMGLSVRNTVIMAPHNHSLCSLPPHFWEMLVVELKRRGFTVCTNVGLHEAPLHGTIPLSISLRDIFQFSELAGWVISVRSGLCDLLSSAGCHLAVMYPKQRWYVGTALTGASLIAMGLSSQVHEYEVEGEGGKPHDHTVERIMADIDQRLNEARQGDAAGSDKGGG